MDLTQLVAMLGVGLGLALLVVGGLSRIYDREEQLADILDLPYGEQDVDLTVRRPGREPLDDVVERREDGVVLGGMELARLDDAGELAAVFAEQPAEHWVTFAKEHDLPIVPVT